MQNVNYPNMPQNAPLKADATAIAITAIISKIMFGVGLSFAAFSALSFFAMRSFMPVIDIFSILPNAIFILVGVMLMAAAVMYNRRAVRQAAKDKEMQAMILRDGVKTTAVITFINQNYGVRINGAPVYSTVEYTFTDAAGVLHTCRNDYVPTEFAIRRGLAVGGRYRLQYLLNDPKMYHVLQTEHRVE